jgi:outer membrane protein assembly factor BamB
MDDGRPDSRMQPYPHERRHRLRGCSLPIPQKRRYTQPTQDPCHTLRHGRPIPTTPPNTAPISNTAKGQIGVHKDSDKGWAQGISLSGNLVWQSPLPNMALTPNLYFPEQDRVISILKSGDVVSLSPKNGQIEWTSKIAKGFATEGEKISNYREDLIAITSEDGIFFIVDATNGHIIFSKKFGKSYGGGVVSMDNKIFVTTDHTIIALKEKE